MQGFVMSSATIKDILVMQQEVQRRISDGSWTMDVQDLKQPKDLAPEPAATPLHMRVVIVRAYNCA